MFATECPYCGSESAYHNGTEMECPNYDSIGQMMPTTTRMLTKSHNLDKVYTRELGCAILAQNSAENLPSASFFS